MFKLHDQVTSKRLGLPMIGKIVGIADAKYIVRHNNIDSPLWDKYYPEWKSGQVATVMFNKPQKVMSLEEYKESLPREIIERADHLDIELHYQNDIKTDLFATYPVDDLEPL